MRKKQAQPSHTLLEKSVWFATTHPAVVLPLDTLLDMLMNTMAGRSGAAPLTVSRIFDGGEKVVSISRRVRL